jgi:hypothetical protein
MTLLKKPVDTAADEQVEYPSAGSTAAAPRHRVWRYAEPAIVLGCFSARDEHAATPGWARGAVQRESGGGALPDPGKSASRARLRAPWARAGGSAPTGRWRNCTTLPADAASRRLLRPADVAAASTAIPMVRWACFGSLCRELVAGSGRKLVASPSAAGAM